MNNKQICLNFVNGETKGKSNNIFIEYNVLYSYDYHFPLCLRLKTNEGKFIFIVNKDKYSSSTLRHQYILKNLINDYFLRNTQELKNLIGLKNLNELVLKELGV